MSKYRALDTETEGFSKKNNITPRNAKMEGLAVAYSEHEAEYETNPEKWSEKIPTDDTTAIFHNARFDLMKLKQSGVKLPEQWEDTLIAAHLIDENSSHGLKDLARKLPAAEMSMALAGVDGVVDYKDVDRADAAAFAEYAKDDAKNTFKLWTYKFERELAYQNLESVYQLEKDIVPVCHQMQDTGMLIDIPALEEFSKFVAEERTRKKAELFEVAGEEFNPDSTKELGKFLYDIKGIRCKKRTPKGKPSTNKEALIDLNHPIADALLEYREMATLENLFTKKIPGLIEEDGRLHPDFNPLGPVTGRFSCSGPNIQQCPSKGEIGRKLRNVFVAPPGKKLVIADYAQAELRILAHYSQDPTLISAYTRDDIDLHTVTGESIFNKKVLSKRERDVAKIINFGIVYGLSAQGLFRRLPSMGIKGFSIEDCTRFIQKYFQLYRGVDVFLRKVERKVFDDGEVKSISGRKRRLTIKNHREIRQAQNFIIQASSADLCKAALIGIYSELPKDCAIIGMVHDEILIEAPEEEAPRVKQLMEQWISQTPDSFTIPMTTTAKIVNRWSEAK